MVLYQISFRNQNQRSKHKLYISNYMSNRNFKPKLLISTSNCAPPIYFFLSIDNNDTLQLFMPKNLRTILDSFCSCNIPYSQAKIFRHYIQQRVNPQYAWIPNFQIYLKPKICNLKINTHNAFQHICKCMHMQKWQKHCLMHILDQGQIRLSVISVFML